MSLPFSTLSNATFRRGSDFPLRVQHKKISPPPAKTLSPKRIAFHIPRWLGDNVMAIPLFHQMRKLFPEAIVCIIGEIRYFDLWQRFSPDDFLPLSISGRLPLFSAYRAGRKMREYQFDLSIILPTGLEHALVCAFAGIPERLGFASDHRGWLLTQAHSIPVNSRETYYAETFRSLLDPCIQKQLEVPPQPAFAATTQELSQAATLLSRNGIAAGEPFAVIHPGAIYGPAKRWPPDRFAALLDALQERYGFAGVIVGGKEECDIANEVSLGQTKTSVQLCGETSLSELIGVLVQSSVVVANDSGVLHLAAALGKPCVGIFGSSSPQWTAPRTKNCVVVQRPIECSPCFAPTCRYQHYTCLREIPTSLVLEAVKSALNSQAGQKQENR